MSRFKDLGEFFDGSLRLPIDGTEYVIPAIDGETGLRLSALFNAGVDAAEGRDPAAAELAQLDDLAERDLYRDALGTAFDAMLSDAVEWPKIKHAALTAFVHWTAGEDAAVAFWESEGKPPARPRRQPQDRKAPSKRTARSSSRSTGAAGTTRRRASTSGTSSRKR